MVAREFECKSREFLDMKPRLHDVQPKVSKALWMLNLLVINTLSCVLTLLYL